MDELMRGMINSLHGPVTIREGGNEWNDQFTQWSRYYSGAVYDGEGEEEQVPRRAVRRGQGGRRSLCREAAQTPFGESGRCQNPDRPEGVRSSRGTLTASREVSWRG